MVNTDLLVEGVHFSDATTGAVDVGWRAAAANLSDLAAMGAEPRACFLNLAVSPDADDPTAGWTAEEIYEEAKAELDNARDAEDAD